MRKSLVNKQLTFFKLIKFVILIAFTFVYLPLSLATQNNLSDQANPITSNTDAKTQLRNILHKLNNFSAEFTQEIVDGNGELIQQASGYIVISKPQKLRWEIITPEPSLLIADGQTIYNIDPFVEQVTLIDQTNMTDSNPLMLLISDEEQEWDNVSVLKQGSSFVISPNQPDSSITQLSLNFDVSNKLTGLSSIDRQEQKSTLILNKLVANQPIALDNFIFEIPENFIVDDQRAN